MRKLPADKCGKDGLICRTFGCPTILASLSVPTKRLTEDMNEKSLEKSWHPARRTAQPPPILVSGTHSRAPAFCLDVFCFPLGAMVFCFGSSRGS